MTKDAGVVRGLNKKIVKQFVAHSPKLILKKEQLGPYGGILR